MNTFYDCLFSIAYMQAAVSKLLEVQAKKVHAFAKGQFTITQANEFNESLKQQMKKLENLHLLLFNKFELIINSIDVKDMRENAEPEIEIAAENKSLQQYEAEQTKPQDEVQLEPQSIVESSTYIFKGRGQGTVSNLKDLYLNGLAVFQTYLSNANLDKKEIVLSYSVMKGTKMLILLSSPEKMKTEFTLDSEHKEAKVEGTGTVIIKERSKSDIMGKGEYLFNVKTNYSENGTCGQTTFEMDIKSIADKQFIHQSGPVKSRASGIVIEPLKNIYE